MPPPSAQYVVLAVEGGEMGSTTLPAGANAKETPATGNSDLGLCWACIFDVSRKQKQTSVAGRIAFIHAPEIYLGVGAAT